MAMRLLQETVEANRYIPVRPTEHQAVFLTCPVLEVLYGGAGGGGKSAALLMAALQYVDRPGYNALLLRRSFADLSLPNSLIPLSREWLDSTPARWSESKHQWTFPSGATITFGYMETDNDRFRYRSAQFQFVGFDELTDFSKIQYLFLYSRMRRLMGSGVPIRMRTATNPGGPGHEWVKTRFIGRRLPDGQFIPIRHPDRLYIPANMVDNPYLDVEEYRNSLKELPPLERRQIEHGDWDARPEGLQFKRDWFNGKVLNRIPCPVTMAVRYWDLAATEAKQTRGRKRDPDYTAGSLLCKGVDGNFYIVDMKHQQLSPRHTEQLVTNTAQEDGYDVWIGMEQEPGASGKIVVSHYRSLLTGYTFKPTRPSGDKLRRSDPFASTCEAGNVYLIHGPWVEPFLDELCSFDGSGIGHDDQVSSTVDGFNLITRQKRDWSGSQWAQVLDRRQSKLRQRPSRGELIMAKLKGHYRSPRAELFPDEIDESMN